ncbi:unnamed protein product, partial [Heterosigma akashiwo]
PDLSPAVGRLARYMVNPGARHMAMAKRTLRYLKGTTDHGLLYRRAVSLTCPKAVAFSDSDWASDLDDRKSTTGYCIFIGLSALSTTSKKCKFIEIKFHFIRDCIVKGLVRVIHISSEENLADLFTKPLGSPRFQEICALLGVTCP